MKSLMTLILLLVLTACGDNNTLDLNEEFLKNDLPDIELLGDDNIEIEYGFDYEDLGVRAIDKEDGDLSSSVRLIQGVDVNKLGEQEIIYEVTDSKGQVVTISRTITVVDTVAPIISLEGDNPLLLDVGSNFSDPGINIDENTDEILNPIVTGFVDINQLGTYQLRYKAKDISGNESNELIRTIQVLDRTAPVISLIGDNPMYVEINTSFSEPGANLVDNYDQNPILNNINNVMVNALGTYQSTFTSMDASGNMAAAVNRTVIVRDTTAPIINLLGDENSNFNYGDTYVEAGYTTSDNSLTMVNVVVENNFNSNQLGTQTIRYTATDSSGNQTVKNRTLTVIDTVKPVISLTNNDITLNLGSSYVEPGFSASDNVDGDLTGAVQISGSVNTSVVGIYILRYDVSDNQGNQASTITRTIEVVDNVEPIINISGDNPLILEFGTPYTELGATASDNIDGDLSSSIQIDASNLDTDLGTYTVTYSVEDGEQNETSRIRTVIVRDTTEPDISLIGDPLIELELLSTYTEQGVLSSDNYDENISDSLNIAGSINNAVVGSYDLTYTVTDNSGNTNSVSRIVNVVDSTPPVISILGDNPLNISLGDSFFDDGASSLDNYDGDISSGVIIQSNNINNMLVGTYQVVYASTDASGNIGTSTRSVIVSDNTHPIISLIGDNPQTIAFGESYSELGATASDNYDGDISGDIIIDTGAINSGAVGSYQVSYEVSDAAGNRSVVNRTINFTDQTAPVPSLSGNNPESIRVGTVYIDAEATALDDVDGLLSFSEAVVTPIGSALNTNIVGEYTLRYTFTDDAGNSAFVDRIVNVIDDVNPIINLSEGSSGTTVTLEVGSSYVEPGYSASDNYDGDLTSAVQISDDINNMILGDYTVTYTVEDVAGNEVSVQRTVTVVDTTAPSISLLGSSLIELNYQDSFSDPGASALDNYDGDISSNITLSGDTVDTSNLGSYTITYNIEDSSGNINSVNRTIIVADLEDPVITILGENPLDIEVFSIFSDPGASALDNYDGDLSSNIGANENINMNLLGQYMVMYSVTDNAGNIGSAMRIVNVVDTTDPVISITGDSYIEIGQTQTYTDQGATALDNYDGDVSGNIQVTNSVDTSTPGTYTVVYTVTDGNNNTSSETRTVKVLELGVYDQSSFNNAVYQ